MDDAYLTFPASVTGPPEGMASGWLCLEFANTVENYRLESPADSLNDYQNLLQFSVRAGVLDDRQADDLRAAAAASPVDSSEAFEYARALRAVLYRVFSGLAHGRAPEPDDLCMINQDLSDAAPHREVATDNGGFCWRWRVPVSSLEAPLWPVLQSAADLLTSPELARLRQCDGHSCTWLFLDRSKNRSRRWCYMQICGNRAKSRRHYARTRTSAAGG